MRRAFWNGLIVLGVLGYLLIEQPVFAQPATTVQLPTFSFFTTSTSVLVPDRGATVLGGNRTNSTGSNFYSQPYLGPVRPSATNGVASQTQVHVQIHDLREMDEALLRQATGNSGSRAGLLPSPVTSSADLPPAGSVADAARARVAEAQAAEREARKFYEQGLAAEANGRPSLARAYYQMAVAKAGDPFKSEIKRRMAALPEVNVPRVARQSQP
ncbi:MAG: hypothetical protein JNM18_17815 [Planctomycetaceae bacterium]|nr:hypothetical protein [Planctomycetaceae bacterium]